MAFPSFAFAPPLFLCATCVWKPAQAAEVCNPFYVVKYSACVTPDSPTVVHNITTDWILVNKGASHVSDEICTGHIRVIAQENPKATNIKAVEMEDKAAPLRGWGKRDVYCKFSMDEPTKQAQENPTCGIQGIERHGCVDRLSLEFLQRCLNAPTTSDEDLWKKAGCLVDSYADAAHISQLDSKTYGELRFQIDLFMNQLAKSASENDRRIAAYVRDHFLTNHLN